MTGHVRSGAVRSALSEPKNDVRRLIADRERTIKRGQARLGDNLRLLGAWQRNSGLGVLNFRWDQVKTMLRDIHDGMTRADSSEAKADA